MIRNREEGERPSHPISKRAWTGNRAGAEVPARGKSVSKETSESSSRSANNWLVHNSNDYEEEMRITQVTYMSNKMDAPTK